MSKTQKTVKLDTEIYEAAREWIEINGSIFNFSSLTEAAIKKFITELHTIEPVALSKEDVSKLTKQAMKKHKKALDRLK